MKKKELAETRIGLITLDMPHMGKVTIDHDSPEEERKSLKILMELEQGARAAELNLEEQMELYLEDTKAEVVSRTQTEKRGAFNVYMKIIPTGTLSHQDANRFSDTLKSLPPNFSKKHKGLYFGSMPD